MHVQRAGETARPLGFRGLVRARRAHGVGRGLDASGSALAASNSVHDRLALPKRFYTLIWPALQAVAMMAGYSLYVAPE